MAHELPQRFKFDHNGRTGEKSRTVKKSQFRMLFQSSNQLGAFGFERKTPPKAKWGRLRVPNL